ncbi:YafY family transcriptional regulator [Chloroflexia bacterium SDU3-3]|nr:YafY family transcriptional regulator [Chloroflexia bacterium SDU3-3]
MYSPTTRLLTILELLQSHHQMSGAEIARRLEVSARTVRRYIVMLQDMGIPIEAVRGSAGAYYLRRGYKLPPLMFSDAEAVALTLGLRMIRTVEMPSEVAAIEGALAKIERVVPEQVLEQVRGVQGAMYSYGAPRPSQLRVRFVAQLGVAARQGRRVFLRYADLSGNLSSRAFDPYGIVCHEGNWYTPGYCHMRSALRIFRIDRIATLDLLDEPFVRPVGFDALQHVISAFATMPGAYSVAILLRGSIEQVRQVLPPEAGALEETADGVIWRRETNELTRTAQLLLSLELSVTILQPPELSEIMRGLAAKALRIADRQR